MSLIRHYDKANTEAITRSKLNFSWTKQLSLNPDVNWQTKIFTETILNIMSNFILNVGKRMVSRDPPWLIKQLTAMLKRKNRLYKNYKRHGYRDEDKIKLQAPREECKNAVETSRLSYLTNLGKKVNDSTNSKKYYWNVINRVINKGRAPKIPPLLVDKASRRQNYFILSFLSSAS